MPINADQPVAANLDEYLAHSDCQLPQCLLDSSVVEMASALLIENGGSTVNLFFGNLGGEKLFAVSLYPDRSRIVPGSVVRPAVLSLFLTQNRDLLSDPRNSIGLWWDVSQNITFIDVTATLPDRANAMALGKQYNQVAIFDLSRVEEIEVGGSGEPLDDLLPALERLPRLDRETSAGVQRSDSSKR